MSGKVWESGLDTGSETFEWNWTFWSDSKIRPFPDYIVAWVGTYS